MTASRLLFTILYTLIVSRWNTKNKFNLQDQKRIGVKVNERKRKYEEDKKNPAINKAVCNARQRKWVHPFTQRGYIQPTVTGVFKDLTDELRDSKYFKSATKFVSHCLEKLEKGEFDLEENCCRNKYCVTGADPPKKALEVQYTLFDYFIDIRYSLKGRLPQHILLSKAKQLYEEYCILKVEASEEPEKLKITQKWLQKWCKDYHISLKYPTNNFI